VERGDILNKFSEGKGNLKFSYTPLKGSRWWGAKLNKLKAVILILL
jgi:hypothetical protein